MRSVTALAYSTTAWCPLSLAWPSTNVEDAHPDWVVYDTTSARSGHDGAEARLDLRDVVVVGEHVRATETDRVDHVRGHLVGPHRPERVQRRS